MEGRRSAFTLLVPARGVPRSDLCVKKFHRGGRGVDAEKREKTRWRGQSDSAFGGTSGTGIECPAGMRAISEGAQKRDAGWCLRSPTYSVAFPRPPR